MNATHRPRRDVSRTTIVLLRPVLRYSKARHAYVLRAVGNRMGPVFRERLRTHESRSEPRFHRR